MSEVLDPRIANVLQNLRDRQNQQQNLCKVGRKIVTERQRRILCGLDVTNRSLDTTTASQNDNTLEDSWLDNSSKKRLELIRQRRSLTRRIGKSMGGNFNQFTMKVPPFDPRIEINASCSEDSADEEENVAGSQGRKGEGCSTPHHVNNTLAALRDIEISVVGFNSTDPEKNLPVVGNNTVEMVDVESREQSLEIIELKQPDNVSAPGAQIEQPAQGGTFAIEEKDIEITGGTGGTYTIRKESPEKMPAVVYQPSPTRKSSLIKDGRKSINKRQSVQFATEVISPASRSFGFSASKFAKQSRILIDTPKFCRRNDDSAENIEETMRSIKISEKTIEFSEPSMIDAESDPRNLSYNQETPKRGGSRLSRRSFVVDEEKPPVSRRYTEENPQIAKKSLEEKPVITVAKSPGPRYSQPTISFLAKSPRISTGGYCRHYMSNYAGGSDYSGDDSSSIVEIEPTMKTADELLKSGYQPRRHISKLQLQQKMKEFNADFDDNAANKTKMEERRKDFMERRLNNTKPMTTPNKSIAPKSVERKPIIRNEVSLSEMADVSQPTATALVVEGAPLGDLGLTTMGDQSRRSTEQEPQSRRSEFTRRFSQLDDIDEGADPYENDGVDTTAEDGIVIRQKGLPEYDSIFSANVPSPAVVHQKKSKKHRQVDDSVVEDYIDHTREMILKPRKLIRPETPTDGLRRSKRTRMPPVRTWMGEQAVYESSPGGSKYLVGSNKVVVRDPRYIKAKTTDPVKALERERGFR